VLQPRSRPPRRAGLASRPRSSPPSISLAYDGASPSRLVVGCRLSGGSPPAPPESTGLSTHRVTPRAGFVAQHCPHQLLKPSQQQRSRRGQGPGPAAGIEPDRRVLAHLQDP
jgi:hypothetical protein